MEMPLLDVAPVSHEGSPSQRKKSNKPTLAFLLLPSLPNPTTQHLHTQFYFFFPFLFSSFLVSVAWFCDFLLSEQVEFTWGARGEGGSLCQGKWHRAAWVGLVLPQPRQGHWGWEHQPPNGENHGKPPQAAVNGRSWLGGVKGRGEKLF